MRIPTAAGGIVEAVAAPADCLDLDSWSGKRIAVVAPALSGTLDAVALASLLRDAAGASIEFFPVETIFSAQAADAALTPTAASGRLRSDPEFALEFERRLVRSLAGTAPDAVLLPPWMAAGVRSLGVPAFVMLGIWGGPSRGRDLADALGAALRSCGADIRFPAAVEAVRPAGDGAGWVVACGGGDRFRARTVVVATGGPVGGGVAKHGRIRLRPDVGVPPAFAGAPIRQDAAEFGPGPERFLPPGIFDGAGAADGGRQTADGGREAMTKAVNGYAVGILVDDGMRVECSPAPGLLAAGEIALACARGPGGLGWAVASGFEAARSALERL